MEIFEAFMILFIPLGTFLLNAWRKGIDDTERWSRAAYFIVSLAMAVVPFIYVQSIESNRSALSVILVGVGFFWFAIVGSRSGANPNNKPM